MTSQPRHVERPAPGAPSTVRRPAGGPRPARAARQGLRASLATLALAGLAACAHRAPLPADTSWLPVPRWVALERLDGGSNEQGMLAVQRMAGGELRWSWFNLLGAPRSRQILADGRWRNDGFLPPDPQARRLFEALLLAWTPPDRRPPPGATAAAPAAAPAADGSLLIDLGGERWRARPLEPAP